MSDRQDTAVGVEQYLTLGLVGNPFVAPGEGRQAAGTAQAVAAAGNRLLARIVDAAYQDKPKPVRVDKTTNIPAQYPARAISNVEHVLIKDDTLAITHGYTQLYMMRRGRVRATLSAFGERIAFRSFDRTLAAYVAKVLETPDESLPSFSAAGEERLAEFAEKFAADPTAAVLEYFGDLELERQPDLAVITDLRLTNLEPDVDEELDPAEVDNNVGMALGTTPVFSEPTAAEGPDADKAAVVDYFIEYTSVHLSSVIARALRVYKERGLAAMSTEFRVTNAPRKTLLALVKFARSRFRKIVLIFDGFDGWSNVPPELRSSIVATFTEMRWQLAEDAVIVMMLDKGVAPELEEQFGAATAVEWEFEDLPAAQEAADNLDLGLVGGWIVAAAGVGQEPAFDVTDPVIESLAEAAEGSMRSFVLMARAAVESAAAREVGALDIEARNAGLQAIQEA